LPARILASGAVSILAAVTTPFVCGEGNRRCDAEDGDAAERRDGLEGRGEALRHEGEQVLRDGRRGRGLAAEQRLLLCDEDAGCGVRLAVGGSGGAGDALRLRLSDACVVEVRLG